jgi:unsaturated rhamnogalacturonyl hydrolase
MSVGKTMMERLGEGGDGEWNLSLDRWDWSQGVGLYGVSRMWEASGNKACLDFVRSWFHSHVQHREFGSVNYVALANTALLLLKEEADGASPEAGLYRQVCTEYADWCLNRALLTSNGGFAHVWGKGGLEDYKNQLWIDTVFMAGIFMIDCGLILNRNDLVEAGIRQFDIHVDCLYDREEQLFVHGYHCIREEQLGEHWGRGNGWMAAGLAELCRLLAGTAYEGESDRFRQILVRLMNRASSLRGEDGLLRTLLNCPEAYPETTATALFGYAALMGARTGILDASFSQWGKETLHAVMGQIGPDGRVMCASGGTDCQEQAGYLRVPYIQSLYAYGIVLMLLSEGLRLFKPL